MSDYKLSHLQELEAEAIYIIREVSRYALFHRKGLVGDGATC